MKTNMSHIPKLSDHGIILNGPISGQQMVSYWSALQQWSSCFGFELTQMLEEAETRGNSDYWRSRADILREILGLVADKQTGEKT
jgi:hypothetical protein